jgi:hypothetical protein
MRKFCSRTHLGVAGPAPSSGTWRLNRQTGSSQCRLRKVPPHNRARTTLPAQAVEFAGSLKTGPRKGQYAERRDGSSRSPEGDGSPPPTIL